LGHGFKNPSKEEVNIKNLQWAKAGNSQLLQPLEDKNGIILQLLSLEGESVVTRSVAEDQQCSSLAGSSSSHRPLVQPRRQAASTTQQDLLMTCLLPQFLFSALGS
jgi:hypothetical protein